LYVVFLPPWYYNMLALNDLLKVNSGSIVIPIKRVLTDHVLSVWTVMLPFFTNSIYDQLQARCGLAVGMRITKVVSSLFSMFQCRVF
jgi:hypothetical protein